MSEDMENQPTQATTAPYRRRRSSRRRSGRRNSADRGPGNSNQPGDANPGGPGGPEVLEEDASREGRRRQEDAGEFVEATEDGRAEGSEGQQNGVEPPREPEYGEGIIEISGKGFGFLRDAKRNFVQTPQDIFVTPEIVRRFQLRDGMWVYGETRRGNRGPQLTRLLKINDEEPTKYQDLRPFEELTTINPNERIKLETVSDRYTTRVMDLMTPLGKGQRGLIVAPPRTGKTTLLQHIADAVVKNHPEMKLIILLVDERPEEVTDFRRSCPQAEIMASSNDSDIKSHTRIAQLAVERAKRLVEAGKDVFILLDSITRTARAFNNATGGGGRTMSGGIDARAMEIPRKLFAAARNTEEAGSLTIVATALIETGSRMDELIFQEFKGTGNMELVLDRKISDLRIYPAVDIFLSGTRREELLMEPWELDKINLIRRGLAGHKPDEAIQRLLMFVKKFPTNKQMLKEIPG
ncbi:MAG TPA: transcription termination factor Rho [Chthoniobacterales bacterium]|jgi:transcription termination factor Rho|nr:transcription termination factor Rho [Chthoniobacterales bacterium]